MARERSDLHRILKALDPAVKEVYFQPPDNLTMQYPCIVYHRDDVETKYADNKPHLLDTRYMVTVIDRNPDSVIHKKVALLPMAAYNRFFTANNLNHDVYTLYF